MITKELHYQVEDKLLELITKAEQIFKRNFPFPKISYKLKGTCAGKANYKFNLIKLNPLLLIQNVENFLNQTVGHELVHLIVRQVFGKVKPHGQNWKQTMTRLGLDNTRCHSYDLSHCGANRKRNLEKYRGIHSLKNL